MPSSTPRFAPGTPAAYWRVQRTPINLQRLVEALLPANPTLVWLDSARFHPATGRFSIVGWDPWLSLSALGPNVTCATGHAFTKTSGDPLEVLRGTLARYPGVRTGEASPPVGLGFLGVFSYELNRWIERLPPPKADDGDTPDLLVFGMRLLVVVDRLERTSWLISVADPSRSDAQARRDAAARLEELEHLVEFVAFVDARAQASVAKTALRVEPTMSQEQFELIVRRAKQHIRSGEIFQANLSQRFHASWSGSTWQLYLALRQVNPSPFACFVQSPSVSIVSCSPERLVHVRDGYAQTRPIAGTRPRGHTPQEDAVNSLELLISDKERAEHLMLVDLERNDLGKICRPGSVTVDEFMTLEDYSHVIHIVSNVRGKLRDEVDTVEVIRAMFPGGTITGCPKVRCMEIIHALEPVRRGFYTGSCGYLGFDGTVDLNILIRTFTAHPGRVAFHVGAGIVADSSPEREYHETLAKAGALLKALELTAAGASTDVSVV